MLGSTIRKEALTCSKININMSFLLPSRDFLLPSYTVFAMER